MSRHSKGEWRYAPIFTASENHKGFMIFSASCEPGTHFATIYPVDEDGKLGEANARLIAAAPELLEALVGLMELVVDIDPLCASPEGEWGIAGVNPPLTPTQEIARLALHRASMLIAKAKGEA